MRSVIDTLDEASLSNLNRTDNITLNTNDTISFYRNFRWYNRFDNAMTTSNYYSRDTITYKVELLDSIDNSRLEILDSFTVLRCVPSGTPSFLGVSNPFKKTFYIISNILNGKKGYVKLSVLMNGDGVYNQARLTSLGINLSSLLTLPSKATYRETFGVGLNKSNIEVNTDKIILIPNPSKNNFIIKFYKLDIDNNYTISIIDINGLIYQNFKSKKLDINNDLNLTIKESGVYFVSISNNTGVISRKKIVIEN